MAAIARSAAPRTISGGGTRLVIEAGTPDPTALSSAIREWIVPMLIREHLAERAAAKASLTTVNARKLDTQPLIKEQRVSPATSQ